MPSQAPPKPKQKRGTRIPDDFSVTPEMVAWARRRCPNVDGRTETEKYVNHWSNKPGKEALKLDSNVTVPLTFIPSFPGFPPEVSWMREPNTAIPGLVLKEKGAAKIASERARVQRKLETMSSLEAWWG